MIVGSPKAKSTNTGTAWLFRVVEPRAVVHVDVQCRVLDVYIGGAFDVDVARQHFVFQSKDYFQHTRTASSCLQMANVALDATDSNLFFRATNVLRVENVLQGGQLDFVPNWSASTMTFDQCCCLWVKPGIVPSASDGELLATYRRGIYPRAFAITTGCNSTQYRMDSIPISLRVCETLHDKHNTSFADQHTFSIFVVRCNAWLGAENRRFGKCHVHTYGVVGAGGASNHCIAISVE